MWTRLQSSVTGIPVECQHCGLKSPLVSQSLGLCSDCIRRHFDRVLPIIKQAHYKAREPFSLPPSPPRAESGVTCRICINECSIPEGEVSYCGLRTNIDGKLRGVTATKANVSWYYDRLPTNCVADWVCPGGTELVILTLHIERVPNMAIRTWLFFIRLVLLTACSARIGTTVN